MASRDLLVPGTGGCKLLLDGKDVGWPTELSVTGWLSGSSLLTAGFAKLGAEHGPDDVLKILSMAYSDDPEAVVPLRTTLQAAGEVTPGPLLHLAYNQFDGLDVLLYDWRGDIRRSAALLLEKLEQPGPPWRIVAHSQGGLVVVAAARLFAQRHNDDDRAFARLVSHVALVGTPLHGTINAADAFITGDQLAAPFRDSFRKIVQTWPALHQMLPVWPGCVRRAVSGAAPVPEPFNLMDPRAWQGQDVAPTDAMLARARLTRALVRDGLGRMNGVKKRILQSRAHATCNHVLVTDGKLIPSGNEPGDTLVPDDTTRNVGGPFQREATHSIGSGGDTQVHFALANDPVVATDVKTFFTQ